MRGSVPHHARNNLISQTDALSRVTSHEYDALNRRTKRTLPGGGLFETFSYNAVGNMTVRSDFNGNTSTFDYDLLNRLKRKTPDPNLGAPPIEFTYTDTGPRASMTDPSGLTTYAYDDRNRLIQKSTPAGTLSYFYDAASNLISMQSSNTNGVWTTYTPDAANRVETVTDQQTTGTTTYTYDKTGVVERIVHPNSVEQELVYDPLYRVTSLPISGAGLLERTPNRRQPESPPVRTSGQLQAWRRTRDRFAPALSVR